MKKAQQLGMNPSTASHRLVKDLLFEYAVVRRHIRCYHCSKHMSREDFSIEHKIPWLDTDDPVGLYFNLENVTFSHKACNYAASRGSKVTNPATSAERMKKWRSKMTPDERKAERRKRYETHGC